MSAGKTVRVVFLDADSGAGLGWTEMPSGQLPESFEARTTMHLGDQDWEVVTAQPMTRAECEATGELRLTLRKVTIQTVAPRDLLYSLPTICDPIPAIASGTSKLGKDVLELHEDDWRQIELVARSQQAEINVGLAAVQRIHAEERTPQGYFKNLHIRREVASPLSGCRLTLAEIYRSLPFLRPLDGLAYRDAAGLVEGGFAAVAPSGLRLYGIEAGGMVAALGLLPYGVRAEVKQEAPALAGMMRMQNLCLIDWCRLRQVPALDVEVAVYLESWVRPATS
jgi:hypothetical protein